MADEIFFALLDYTRRTFSECAEANGLSNSDMLMKSSSCTPIFTGGEYMRERRFLSDWLLDFAA